jgi:cell division protein ZapE
MSRSVSELYAARVAAGEIERDPAQAEAVARLAALQRRLAERRLARKSSSLGWLFGRRDTGEPLRGLYIHGEVGRGKTMLMDLFFAASPVVRKRRAHFHAFMADVQTRLNDLRHKLKTGEIVGKDPIQLAAAAIAEEAWLICFDEFQVTDIADAMILGRLFAALFEHGVVVVATSNVMPQHLYAHGLNRALFLPFIALIERHMEIVELNARTDFRTEKLGGIPVWLVPDDAVAQAALQDAWGRLTGGAPDASQELLVKGRIVRVPRATAGVARFMFHELCEQPLGASDYLTIANAYHALVIEHIPVMGFDARNAAKRFIILIDLLYERGVKLIASAAAEPDALYRADTGFEVLEFRRTASRLIEMRSQSYLAMPHVPREAGTAGTVMGIVET